MNWDALGAIAELVSAIGVIATLFYLAIQIRTNTQETRIAATGQVSQEMNQFLQHVTSNQEISELWLKSLSSDPTQLSEIEVQRAVMIMGSIVRILENAYLLHLEGRMKESDWQGYKRFSDLGLNSKLFPIYWARRRVVHSDEFAEFVEDMTKNSSGVSLFEEVDNVADA